MNYSAIKGFALIELSVLLVFIGLVASGIIMGQTLLHDSRLRSTISTMQKYKEAIGQFQEKYHALPGDMAKASKVFGKDCDKDCNGNGDGKIQNNQKQSEGEGVWQHLSLAGMVAEKFQGPGSSPSKARQYVGVTNPAVPLKNGDNNGMVYVHGGHTLFSGRNYIGIGGGMGQTYADFPSGALLTPAEVYSIERKYDDSRYDQGNWRAMVGTQGPEFTSGSGCFKFAGLDMLNREVACVIGNVLE